MHTVFCPSWFASHREDDLGVSKETEKHFEAWDKVPQWKGVRSDSLSAQQVKAGKTKGARALRGNEAERVEVQAVEDEMKNE